MVELEVVAILQDRLGLPSILLPWTMAAAHSSAPMADIVYVAVDWGADVSAIEAAVGPAIVTGSDSYLTTLDAEFDRLSRLALLAIVGIAVASRSPIPTRSPRPAGPTSSQLSASRGNTPPGAVYREL